MAEVSFGEWLKRRRKAQGLTQEALALQINCSTSALRKIEAEQRRPSAQIVEQLAEVFNIAPSERKSFLKFARGNWEAAPTGGMESAPWRGSSPFEDELEELSNPKIHLATFLFTDIEGSTKLWESAPEKMKSALQRHHAILQEAILSSGGNAFQIVGDAFCAVFPTASSAISAALTAQCVLYQEQWDLPSPIRVRMGIHTGAAERTSNDSLTGGYASNHTLNRVSRILSAGHGGQVLLSLATKELVKDSLPADTELRDMGEHHLKNLTRPEHLFQLSIADQPSEFSLLNTLESYRHNLPLQLTSFVGREREIAEVKYLLSATRLLTLIGPGGTGKTRLSIQVAGELLGEFEDGVWLVELASLAEPSLVSQSVASVLGVHEQSGQTLIDVLSDYLLSRHILLVIDNCEHLVSACAQLAERLLRKCPNLRILATSREMLGITGESVWSVPPLSLPEPQPWQSPESAQDALSLYEESESVQLFVARARATSSDFRLTSENGAWIAEICRHLDGMPLAIELAAARVRSLSVQQIAQRLDDRFHLLTGGSRTAPLRQQTLAATLDWSYALLSEIEQKVLQRLSVFAGSATLEAAESVCAGEGVESAEVLDTLSHLVDKSLVTATSLQRGEMRYRLLETIHQYALAKLGESGEADESKNRHLNYFVQWAERAEPHLDGGEQVLWLKRFEIDHDNLFAALEWSLMAASRIETSLQLAAITAVFWKIHGNYSEGRVRLTAALAQEAAQSPTLVRAKALIRTSTLTFFQSDYPATRALADESLAICREHGLAGRLGVADALETLAEVASETGDYSTATKFYEEALPLYREVGNLAGIGGTLKMLGWGAMRTGDYELAESRLNEGLIVCRQSGNLHQILSALSGLGELALRQGRYARAQSLLQESLSISQSTGEKWGLAIVLGSLGWVALRQHDFKEMRKLLSESLTVRMETGDKGGMAWCLEKLAEANSLRSRFQPAVIIFGAASALRAPVGSAMDAVDKPDYERLISRLRTALGKEAFTAAWTEGQAMKLEQAIDYALAEPEPAEIEVSLKEKYGGLTEREREAAMLIARGKSNREIAKAMTIGAKTVETYVTRILNKLGFESRVQIAVWAIEKGLNRKESE